MPELPDITTDLPDRLRLQTRDLHIRSERSGVMAELLGQRLGRAAYCALLRNLQAVYVALEDALAAPRPTPWLPGVDLAALRRAPALACDLVLLHGPGWRDELPLVPATSAYVLRLQSATPLLAAHAYVRYLGDLHGGQMLKRLVGKVLGLTPDLAEAATRFYDFGDEDRVQALRQGFRQGLAALDVDEEAAQQLVAEARWAFAQHIQMFEQLDGCRARSA